MPDTEPNKPYDVVRPYLILEEETPRSSETLHDTSVLVDEVATLTPVTLGGLSVTTPGAGTDCSGNTYIILTCETVGEPVPPVIASLYCHHSSSALFFIASGMALAPQVMVLEDLTHWLAE